MSALAISDLGCDLVRESSVRTALPSPQPDRVTMEHVHSGHRASYLSEEHRHVPRVYTSRQNLLVVRYNQGAHAAL